MVTEGKRAGERSEHDDRTQDDKNEEGMQQEHELWGKSFIAVCG